MTRSPKITRDCPFCGEAEHLSVGDGCERVAVIDGKATDDPTHPRHGELEYVDEVCCGICEAMAPLDTWNGTRPAADYAALRDFDPPPGTP